MSLRGCVEFAARVMNGRIERKTTRLNDHLRISRVVVRVRREHVAHDASEQGEWLGH